MNSLQTVLQNAIIGWWEDTLESYDEPNDPDFVHHVCETIGISEEEYKHIMAESADVEEWLILSNNSVCDDLSVHTFVGTKHDAYKKMQAMVLATAAQIDEGCQIEVDTNPSEMTAYIRWTDIEDFHEDFKVVKKSIPELSLFLKLPFSSNTEVFESSIEAKPSNEYNPFTNSLSSIV